MTQFIPSENNVSPTARRALVVDDHEDSAKALAVMLRSLGFETEVALDGIEGLRRAAAFKPGLLLLDINMPKLDGYDTCGVIRAQPWGAAARLVAVTGATHPDSEHPLEKTGFDDWLVKPVEFEDLRKITDGFPDASIGD